MVIVEDRVERLEESSRVYRLWFLELSLERGTLLKKIFKQKIKREGKV